MNAINIIAPYKYLGMWVFDDPRLGLVQEPFVAGADTMIDRVTENIPEAEKGFLMLFRSGRTRQGMDRTPRFGVLFGAMLGLIIVCMLIATFQRLGRPSVYVPPRRRVTVSSTERTVLLPGYAKVL